VRFRRLSRFREEYDSLQLETRLKVDKTLKLLLANPRHPSLCVKKMHGKPAVWEARVDRQHRMTFEIQGDLYVLRGVGKHDETIRQP
jgi:hypothetical protein